MSILLVILFGVQIICGKEIEIKFIKDFLNTEFHNVQVNAFLCWDKDDLLQLTKRLFLENKQINIQVVDSFTYYEPSPDLLFLIDSECYQTANILFLANMQKSFASPYKWLLLSNNFTSFKSKHNLNELDILVDSSFYLGQKLTETEYSLNEVFKYNRTGLLVNRILDTWSNKTGFNHTLPTILSRGRHNLMGTKIVGAAVILDNNTFDHLYDYRYNTNFKQQELANTAWPNFQNANLHTYIPKNSTFAFNTSNISDTPLSPNQTTYTLLFVREKHLDSITKLNFKLVNIMIEYFNGTKGFEYYNSWGYKKPSEKFYTGMIGALQTGHADIGCTSLFVNTERLQAIDYMSWTTPTAIQFVFKQPPLSYVSNLFTLPFSRTVWLSIFGLFLVAVLFIYLITVWERKNMDERDVDDDSFLEVIMLAVGAVCQQGTTYEPKSGTGKIITFLIFIALLFIYVSYSAYIVVLLQSTSNDIQSLDDLLKSKMSIGLSEAPYNYFYFQNATEPTRKAIYEKKIMPKGTKAYMSLEEGMNRVRNGFFAFHHETPPMYTIIGKTFYESEKCGLQNLQYIEASQFWLPCKKKSSFKEIFKVCLRKLAEIGIQSRESSRLFDEKPKCLGGGSNFVSVGLIDAGPAFAFLGAGFGVAVLLFVLEHVIYRAKCCRCQMQRKKSK